MPVDVSSIDELLSKELKRLSECSAQIDNLRFVKHKLEHGTQDEMRLIYLMSKLTIENIDTIMNAIKKALPK